MRLFRPCATALSSLCLGVLAACEPSPQPPGLLVNTTPPGASCTVTRTGQPPIVAEPTPAIARLDAAAGTQAAAANAPVTVNCRRRGFADTMVTVPAAQNAPTGFVTGYSAAYPDQVDIALVPSPGWATPPH